MTKISPSSRRRSRIAHFKAPFVLSIAAPAVLGLGCGGKTDGALDQTIEGSSPVAGEPCDARSAKPAGDGYCPAPECIDGRWVVATCNPPPQDYCLDEPPPPPDPTCFDGPYCENGQWQYAPIACNPPPVPLDCPPEQPPAGESCAEYVTGQSCDYEFCGGTLPMVVCNENATWEELPIVSCNPPPPPDYVCPTQAPTAGDSCSEHATGLTCSYEFCGGITPMIICGPTHVWEALLQPPCNPPPPDCFFDQSCAPGSVDAGAPDGGG